MKRAFFFVTTLGLGIFTNALAQLTFPYILQKQDLGMCVYGEADFNQDGYRDLAARTYGGIMVYSGIDLTVMYSNNSAGDLDRNSITSLDANLDGYPDLVVPTINSLMVFSGKDWSKLYQKDYSALYTVDHIMDLNGDGIEELVIGGSPNCYVISGKNGSLLYTLNIPSYVGTVLALQDMDGDGITDFAISSDREGVGGDSGTVTIVSARTGQILRTIIGVDYGFGNSMSTCPDQDEDGLQDLVIGVTGRGDSALVYSTATGLHIKSVRDPFGLKGNFGVYIGNLGDLNGDSYEDFSVSDLYGFNQEDTYWSGAVFIFSGYDLKLLYTFYGVPYSFFGLSVTSLGDLNRDGRQEIAIGAPWNGKVYIFSTFTPGDANQDGKISLADIVVKINYVFRSGPRPLPMSVADDDCNGTIDLNDIICAVNYIFKGQTQGCCLK